MSWARGTSSALTSTAADNQQSPRLTLQNLTFIDSVFTHNHAVGFGGNPAQANTPGGGSGGAIYNDGNSLALSICGSRIESNDVRAFGSAVFFVSNTGVSMHEDTRWFEAGSIIE